MPASASWRSPITTRSPASTRRLPPGSWHGVEVVPATEITIVDPVAEDLHVLGYRVDHRHSGLLRLLDAARSDREARAQRMRQALRALGWKLDEAALDARVARWALRRPAASGGGSAARATQRSAARGGGHRRHRRVHLPLSRPRPTGVRGAHDADRRAGDPRDPRRRWRRRVGTPVLGPPRRDHRQRDGPALHGHRPRWRRGVLHDAHARAVRTARRVVRRARPADDRLGGLPWAEPPPVRRFRAFSTYGHEPELGPVAGGARTALNRG